MADGRRTNSVYGAFYDNNWTKVPLFALPYSEKNKDPIDRHQVFTSLDYGKFYHNLPTKENFRLKGTGNRGYFSNRPATPVRQTHYLPPIQPARRTWSPPTNQLKAVGYPDVSRTTGNPPTVSIKEITYNEPRGDDSKCITQQVVSNIKNIEMTLIFDNKYRLEVVAYPRQSQ